MSDSNETPTIADESAQKLTDEQAEHISKILLAIQEDEVIQIRLEGLPSDPAPRYRDLAPREVTDLLMMPVITYLKCRVRPVERTGYLVLYFASTPVGQRLRLRSEIFDDEESAKECISGMRGAPKDTFSVIGLYEVQLVGNECVALDELPS